MNINANAMRIPLADKTVQTCVTSPPYFGLRDYGVAGQIGMEPTPAAYVAQIVAVMCEVRRVLRDDGTLFLNLGDSYQTSGPRQTGRNDTIAALPAKNLIGIPWRVAFALQSDGADMAAVNAISAARAAIEDQYDGEPMPDKVLVVLERLEAEYLGAKNGSWILRQDIIWAKPSPMPESVIDRCTKAHEYIFMLAKRPRYYYDAAAIRNPMAASSVVRLAQNVLGQVGSARANGGTKTNGNMKAVGRVDKQRGHGRRHEGFNGRWDAMTHEEQCAMGSNKRSVWTVATQGYSGAHFATFPPDLIRPCVLAGAPVGGIVLDPFGGSGTTVQVAREHGRIGIGLELNREYIGLAQARNAQATIWEVAA